MRRAIAVLSSVAVLGGAASAAAASSAPQVTQPRTVRLVAVTDRQTTLDFHTAGFSLGDQLIFAGSLQTPSGADQGRFDASCTVTDTLAEGMFQCQYSLALPEGVVAAQGLASPVGPQSQAAVIGGTRRYQNARGQVLAKVVDATTTQLALFLLP